jgi:membrane-associated phospholipid phosphatase/tRNA A-37 threonylcarbamoyl transferase component Bud32
VTEQLVHPTTGPAAPVMTPKGAANADTTSGVHRLRRVRPQRRPTGKPPPLPHHPGASGVGWLAAAGAAVATCLVAFGGGVRGLGTTITIVDDALVRGVNRVHMPGLGPVTRAIVGATSLTVVDVAVLVLLVALAALRRFRHLIVLLVAAEVSSLLVNLVLRPLLQRPRPFGVVTGSGWSNFAMPSAEISGIALVGVGVLYAIVPHGPWRNVGKWIAAGVVAVVALARISLALDAPTDVLVGALLGVAIPLVGFRVFAPATIFPLGRRGSAAHLDIGGARGQAIRQAVEQQLGLIVSDVTPVGWSGSGGSTPLRLTCRGDSSAPLFAKLYARTHLRADRWYKLGRELLYGRLEDERPFTTVRRLVQQEDYSLQVMHRAGLPTPESLGFVELTPGREYLLVTEFFEDAAELGDVPVDYRIIDSGLGIIRKLWDAGLAHRDIKPANLLVRGEEMLLIDVAFAEIRPSPWRQAVDLANMMLCLALQSSAELVYHRALLQFNVAEITEAFGAARGLALPSQLRHALGRCGRDVRGDFLRLLPSPPDLVRLQRWNGRRIVLWAAVIFAAGLLVAASVPILSAENRAATPLRISDLGCDHLEPLWLEAQAVPTASFVPCLRPLPIGWSVAGADVHRGGATITLDHDRAGPGALRIVFAGSCDTSSAIETVSDGLGIGHYEDRHVAGPGVASRWYEAFAGGCVTVDLVSRSDRAEVTAEVRRDAGDVLGFTSRGALRGALARRSSGELRLDAGVDASAMSTA